MSEDSTFELGWGFWLIIVPLVCTILMEVIIKPLVRWLDNEIFKMKMKSLFQKETLKKLKKWINF